MKNRHRWRIGAAFEVLSATATRWAGGTWAFAIALGTVVAWAVAGPIFQYSDTWQLTINTGTTIVTFLMVFLIQNTQYRDAEATQVKLDEIIRAMGHAQNELLDLEELEEEDLNEIKESYQQLARKARGTRERREAAAETKKK